MTTRDDVINHAIAELFSISGIITVLITVAILIMVIQSVNIPDWFSAGWGLMIGSYFRGVTQVQPLKNSVTTMEVKK